MRPKPSVSPTAPICSLKAKSFSKAPAKNCRTIPWCVKNTSAATSSSAAKNSIKIPTHQKQIRVCIFMRCTLALFLTRPLALFRFCGKFLGIEYALLPNREWNQKKHKKQPWTNVECFAFGGATVRFASLETSFHAANHTIPPPPSYKGLPLCPKDKNRSPFHGEKPLMIKYFLEGGCIKSNDFAW